MVAKVLLACREDDCRDKVLTICRESGIPAQLVWDDTDLLLEILEKDYPVVIYDFNFSQLDGMKMIKIIRKIRPKVKLIVLSSDPDPTLVGKILQEGVAYFSVKPINPAAMKGFVCSLLGEARKAHKIN